jgi:1-acyl-sn-glycerol-3-phosphate acyltransferase
MDNHSQNFSLAVKNNEKLVFPYKESNKSRLVGKLRYWWCWLVASVMLLFVAFPVMLFLLVINKKLWLYPFCDWGAKTWLKACGAKVKVRGLENLKEGQGYIFVSNHRSYLDTATLFAYAGRRIGLVAKKELLKFPVFGQGMGFVNIIAIDRSNPKKARESMEKAKAVVDSGYSFGVFAEGRRALPGELLPFKKGAIHLALQTNAPIIPVVIKNTDRMMGKKTGVAYPGTIEVVLLPAVETEGKTAEKDLMNILVETREAIARELKEGEKERNGRPGIIQGI